VVSRLAARLFREVDTSGGIRLLGVGVSGLADWVQRDLFTAAAPLAPRKETETEDQVGQPRRWIPGMDVVHSQHGPGWVWGSGRGRVTVRFETADTGPGPVHTFPEDDPDLTTSPPPPQ
jgi:DNA polymerase-4